MGCCWATNRTNQLQFSALQTKNVDLKIEKVIVDESNTLIKSYEYQQKNIFKKRIYDWKSIPMINSLHFESKTSFEIKNNGIKQNNFVVGVIKKSAISLQISLPWRTQYCICYQSHQQLGESGIIYEGNLLRMGQGIKQGEIVKIIVGLDQIEWKLNRKTLASIKLPLGFRNDQILPYVALFNPGDSIQIISQVQFIAKKIQK